MRSPSIPRERRNAVVAVVVLFVALAVAMDGLQFAPTKDETHFWPHALQFSHSWVPSIELLRDYGELNTPLPFIVFGVLERTFGGGIPVGRAFNAALGLAMACALILLGRDRDRDATLSTLGLLLCPYFLGCSLLLYTDIIACGFVMIGFWCYLRGRHVAGAVAFVLAIASRQYMVAMPAAIAAYELAASLRSREYLRVDWLAPALAAGSIVGWLWFFGGPGPPAEVERQAIITAAALQVLPDHALYFLSCLGVYFVLPEAVFFWRTARPRVASLPTCLAIAGGLAGLFVLFPPTGNIAYTTDSMGLLDRGVRLVVGDNTILRVAIFYLAALATCIRFSRFSLPLILVAVNALLLIKAQIIWDKYALPLLVILWLLSANSAQFDSARWRTPRRDAAS